MDKKHVEILHLKTDNYNKMESYKHLQEGLQEVEEQAVSSDLQNETTYQVITKE